MIGCHYDKSVWFAFFAEFNPIHVHWDKFDGEIIRGWFFVECPPDLETLSQSFDVEMCFFNSLSQSFDVEMSSQC
jgi:hypothetical protein